MQISAPSIEWYGAEIKSRNMYGLPWPWSWPKPDYGIQVKPEVTWNMKPESNLKRAELIVGLKEKFHKMHEYIDKSLICSNGPRSKKTSSELMEYLN